MRRYPCTIGLHAAPVGAATYVEAITLCIQVRRYPGPYECYDIRAPDAPVALEVALTTLGARALPDTKVAQMFLQSEYGKQR